MKKVKKKSRVIIPILLPFLLIGFFGFSCGSVPRTEGGEVEELAVEPEAEPDYNESYRGVYKGVLTTADSSGMFDLNIKNKDDETILLTGTYNGVPFSLSGSETYQDDEEEYLYEFSGTSDGEEYTIDFTTEISLTGEIDKGNTTFRADGEPVHVNMFKETSDKLVRVYEGSYSGNASGNWNYVLRGAEISGYYAGDGTGEFSGRFVPDSALGGNENTGGNPSGPLFVWGEDGNMLARGTIRDVSGKAGQESTQGADGDMVGGTTSGVWIHREAGGFSGQTARSAFPREGETDNRWSGDRTL